MVKKCHSVSEINFETRNTSDLTLTFIIIVTLTLTLIIIKVVKIFHFLNFHCTAQTVEGKKGTLKNVLATRTNLSPLIIRPN